jgi:hypothetical protein
MSFYLEIAHECNNDTKIILKKNEEQKTIELFQILYLSGRKKLFKKIKNCTQHLN